MTSTRVSIKNSGKEYKNIAATQTSHGTKVVLSFKFADVNYTVAFAAKQLKGTFDTVGRDSGTCEATWRDGKYRGKWRNHEGKSGEFILEWHGSSVQKRPVDAETDAVAPFAKRLQRCVHGQASVSSEPAAVIARAPQHNAHLFAPDQADDAHQHLREHGYVAISGQVDHETLGLLNQEVDRIVKRSNLHRKKGNRGENRHELGHDLLHNAKLLTLVDRAGVDKVLSLYWGSKDYRLQLMNGIVSLPGSKSQGQHIDTKKDIEHLRMDTAPALKVYFNLVDFNDRTGPTRFVPGSHKKTMRGKFPNHSWEGSALAYAPAGSAVIMDMRTWHGGTANRSEGPRPIIGLHFCEPGFDGHKRKIWWNFSKDVDKGQYQRLSKRAQELCERVRK